MIKTKFKFGEIVRANKGFAEGTEFVIIDFEETKKGIDYMVVLADAFQRELLSICGAKMEKWILEKDLDLVCDFGKGDK